VVRLNVLHAGTALIAGAGRTVLFGVIGLAASVPYLIKRYRRFGTWLAPAIALLVFSYMFAVSAFVIGLAISGTDSTTPTPIPATVTGPATGTPVDHEGHHPTG